MRLKKVQNNPFQIAFNDAPFFFRFVVLFVGARRDGSRCSYGGAERVLK